MTLKLHRAALGMHKLIELSMQVNFLTQFLLLDPKWVT